MEKGDCEVKVKREGQISHQIQKQEESLTALEDVVSRLLGKLEAITTSPTPTDSNKNTEEVLVELAAIFQKSNFRIEHVLGTIVDLIERIEL